MLRAHKPLGYVDVILNQKCYSVLNYSSICCTKEDVTLELDKKMYYDTTYFKKQAYCKYSCKTCKFQKVVKMQRNLKRGRQLLENK